MALIAWQSALLWCDQLVAGWSVACSDPRSDFSRSRIGQATRSSAGVADATGAIYENEMYLVSVEPLFDLPFFVTFSVFVFILAYDMCYSRMFHQYYYYT